MGTLQKLTGDKVTLKHQVNQLTFTQFTVSMDIIQYVDLVSTSSPQQWKVTMSEGLLGLIERQRTNTETISSPCKMKDSGSAYKCSSVVPGYSGVQWSKANDKCPFC